MKDLVKRLEGAGVFAVVVVEDEGVGWEVGRALVEGGVGVVEFALRGRGAVGALRRMREAFPGLVLGAGTVLTVEEVLLLREVGVDFAVSPGMSERVVAAAREVGLVFAPGVATPGEMQRAWEMGCGLMKFFPAEGLGGVRYLRMAAGPLEGLGVRFLAMGGIEEGQVEGYLREGLVAAVGGSWLVPREAVVAGRWGEVREVARRAVELVRRVRGGGDGS